MVMICEIVAYCIVGGVQIGPNQYVLQVLDTENLEIMEYVLPMPRMVVPPQIMTEMSEV